MNGQDVLSNLERIMRDRGVAMTLARTGASDLSVYGKAFGAAGEDLSGTLDDTVRRIKITNAAIAEAAWPGPPRKGDTIGGYGILSVDTRLIGDVVVLHVLDVAQAL